eukprot:IDg19643t1
MPFTSCALSRTPAFAAAPPSLWRRASRTSNALQPRRVCVPRATRVWMGAGGEKQTILVFGGGSTLGADVVARFSDGGWRVVTLDYYDASVECGGVNGCVLPAEDVMSLALPAGAPSRTQARVAAGCVASALGENGRVDIVLNATLGFTAAGLGDGDALFDAWEYMQRTSVESSLVAATLAARFLAPDGMLALLGSVAALANTRAPRLLGFGCAKAAV